MGNTIVSKHRLWIDRPPRSCIPTIRHSRARREKKSLLNASVAEPSVGGPPWPAWDAADSDPSLPPLSPISLPQNINFFLETPIQDPSWLGKAWEAKKTCAPPKPAARARRCSASPPPSPRSPRPAGAVRRDISMRDPEIHAGRHRIGWRRASQPGWPCGGSGPVSFSLPVQQREPPSPEP